MCDCGSSFKGSDLLAKHLNEECVNVEGRCTTCDFKILRSNFASHDCVSALKITLE
jgi:hypothetical protein